ncbi:MAG: LPS assembly lipoprotein LptE [Methylococcales bacterium]|nr:hypothetical protein [Methylococcaceae bacterium]HIL41327.1 hypothetical protein [Methylococcales bacterium]
MNRLIINIFTVVFCVFFITACGYKIRGQVVLPGGIEAIHLVGASNDLSRAFEKALRFSSAALVKKATYTSVTIKIIEDRFKRRTASLTQRGKSTEFELTNLLRYEVYDWQGGVLIDQQQLSESRVYFNDQSQVIAKQNEEKIIRQEIYMALISRLLDQVSLGLLAADTPVNSTGQNGLEITPNNPVSGASVESSTEHETTRIVNEVRKQVDAISQTVQELEKSEKIERKE